MFKRIKSERQIISTSATLTFTASIIGVLFGIILKSEYILFDGINNLTGIVMSLVVIITAGYMRKKDYESFPYGKEGISPLLVLMQYLVTLIVLILAFKNALKTIITGGSKIELRLVFIYTLISTIFFNFIYFGLKRLAKRNPTILVKAEINQWRVDATMSFWATIAFLISLVLIHFDVLVIAPYIDSGVLLLVSLYLMIEPIKEIIKSLKELVQMKVIDSKTEKFIRSEIKKIKKKYLIDKDYTRILKTGNLIFIEIDFIVKKDWQYDSILEQDIIRNEIIEVAKIIKFEKWISVSFTHLEKFAI